LPAPDTAALAVKENEGLSVIVADFRPWAQLQCAWRVKVPPLALAATLALVVIEPAHVAVSRGATEEAAGAAPGWKTATAGRFATAAIIDLALDLIFEGVPVMGLPFERAPFALDTERFSTEKISPREAGVVVTLCPLIAVTVP
jgi:hypothetical protein